MSALDNIPLLHLPRFLIGRWLDIAAGALGVLAICATITLSLRLLGFQTEPVRMSIAATVTLLSCLALFLLRFKLSSGLIACYSFITKIPVVWILLIGILLRLIWILFFPAQPGSDGAVYMSLASRLRAFEEYEIAGTRAYWPPGYAMVLAVWGTLVPAAGWLYWTLNLVLFSVMFAGVVLFTQSFVNSDASRFAGFLLALWPNYVTSTATPEKELVVAALLPWILIAIVKILMVTQRTYRLAYGAGLLLGICILIQPSIQLLVPVAILLIFLGCRQNLITKLAVVTLLVLGTATVVAPWTYRNYQVFDSFLLVSSNGGSNFYRANNPLASGGYTVRGEVDLSHLEELQQDKEGKRLAKEWIRTNPLDFAKLVLEKQIRFMGDDATGVYTALKVGGASDNGSLYAILKMAANGWWILAWSSVILMVVLLNIGPEKASIRLLVWLWLYFFVLHSVFESAGKYHMPALWVLPCLIASYAAALDRRGIRKL